MSNKHRWRMAGVSAAVILTAGALVSNSRIKTTPVQPPSPTVEVVGVEQRNVPVYHEWIGTLDGLVNASIRAQETGYLITQNYSEGSFVRKGQLLFQIDARPFQAALAQARGQLAQANAQLSEAKAQYLQAKAQLASAEANQHRAQFDEERYIPLAKRKAITQQDLDNAIQTNSSSKAQVEASSAQVEAAAAQVQASAAAVEAAKAALETANVNFGFTKLYSPVDGIAGAAQIQIGNLVSPTTTNPITTVSTVDPIKVNFALSEQEYLKVASNPPKDAPALDLILTDGSVYPHKGRFAFAERSVDQNTGAIQITALFPNPGNVLRPGQYGKVRARMQTIRGALVVPQRAVSELQGSYQIATVDRNNMVNVEPVKVGQQIGSMWVIRDGLKPGDRVVVEGVQKAMPGMRVNPQPLRDETEPPEAK